MRKICFCAALVFLQCLHAPVYSQGFSLESVTGYPFISEVATTRNDGRMAIAVNEKGKRNIYVAQAPAFELKKITSYNEDEGLELTSLTLSADGKWIVYVRGGDHGAFDGSIRRNPSSLIKGAPIQIFSLPFEGGSPVLLAEGDDPVIDPQNENVYFLQKGQVWRVPVDGRAKAENLFVARGSISDLRFSPDGRKILFTCSRGNHSFIGMYIQDSSSLKWIAPAFARDQSPRWSPDGEKIVFVRRPAASPVPDSQTVRKPMPWSIWVSDADSKNSREIWHSTVTLEGSVPASGGRYNLHWAANDRIVFLSYQDGWPHLYSIPASGGEPLLLTPGAFNVEQITLSPDKKWLACAVNTGPDKSDRDRRHIARVPVDKAALEILTPGSGIESTPVFINQGNDLIFLSATAQRPTLAAVMPFRKGTFRLIGENFIGNDFPVSKLVMPEAVQFKAADGEMVYGQLFRPANAGAKSPAVLFIHGGPQRQMLLGWHYMDYYANTYAINQYLASKGFIVLSVNYRLGVGYGFHFQHPAHSGRNGCSEYTDIRAAGQWLASRKDVDAKRIGVYGGSYGGYLTAMALARDSKIFAAGVDISGMHNFLADLSAPDAVMPPDYEQAKKLMWQSSPSAYLSTWTSPVLIISGDDDGNVPFYQSVDLITRMEQKKFPFESLVFPDETHHWLKYANMLKMDETVATFLEKELRQK